MLHRSISVILFFLIGLPCFGQSYSFINYSIKDGLAQSQATDIVQDQDGYLWISTLGGLSAFDGNKFENYSKENGLLDNHIHTLFHHEGTIYAGVNGGLSIIKNRQIESHALPPEFSEVKILSISYHANTIWIGTDIAGLWKLYDGQMTFIENLPVESVKSIYSLDNFLLLGTKEGLFRYSPENDDWDIPFPGLHEVNIHDILIDEKNILWVGTYDGLFVHEKSLERYDLHDGIISNRIRDVHQDNNGNIWVSSKEGISKIGSNEIANFNRENGLINQDVKSVFCDTENNIWIATNGGGVFRFTGEQLYTFTKDNKVCSDQTLSIVDCGDDEIWLGSFQEGLCHITKDGYEQFKEESLVLDNPVWCGIQDSEKTIWFGTSNGLLRIKGEEFEEIRNEDVRSGDNRITALFEDSGNKIWIGYKNGVRTFENGVFKNYTKEQRFFGSRIRNIQEDKNGNIWMGAENGLFKYANHAFSKITQGEIFNENSVLNISIGEKEELWLGTKDGLYLYNGSNFHKVFLDESFSSNYINFNKLYENNLIIGTNNGLYVLDILKYKNGHKNYVKHLGLEEGLPSLECNLNAIKIIDDSKVLFGTGKGLVSADLIKLLSGSNKEAPKVHITNVRIFMNDFVKRSEVEKKAFGLNAFQANENHVTFDVTGISLSNPKAIEYEYRLKGMQEQFLPLKNSSFVSFPFLPHGQYEFEIYALSDEGVRSSIPALYAFEVIAPFHKTTFFTILMILLGICIAALIAFWRRNIQRRKIENQRLLFQSRILSLEQQSLNSSMNRHFIFNALNSIQYYINRQDKLSANKYLSNFAKLIRKNLDSSQENLTLLSNELERIDLYLSLEHMRFQDKFDYEIEISPKVDAESVKIPSMLLQPFLENSIWHGILPKEEKGKISLKIDRSLSGSIKITIDDDGIGVKQSLTQKNGKSNLHESKGVSLTNDRIVLYQKLTHENFRIKGPYELRDDLGQTCGTRVEIFLPESQTFEEIIIETNKLGKLALNT